MDMARLQTDKESDKDDISTATLGCLFKGTSRDADLFPGIAKIKNNYTFDRYAIDTHQNGTIVDVGWLAERRFTLLPALSSFRY
jgi:hypothetical protein